MVSFIWVSLISVWLFVLRRRHVAQELHRRFPFALLTGDEQYLKVAVPQLASLTGATGASLTLWRAWRAGLDDDLTTAHQLCTQLLRGGAPTSGHAALVRAVLARCDAALAHPAAQVQTHIQAALAQTPDLQFRAALLDYFAQHGLVVPPEPD